MAKFDTKDIAKITDFITVYGVTVKMKNLHLFLSENDLSIESQLVFPIQIV